MHVCRLLVTAVTAAVVTGLGMSSAQAVTTEAQVV